MNKVSNFLVILYLCLLLIANSLSIKPSHKQEEEAATTYVFMSGGTDPNQQPAQGPKLGGWNPINVSQLDQYQNLTDKTIRDRFSELQNASLVSGKSQVVNGWNYQFTYELKQQSENGSKNTNTTWIIGSYLSNENNATPLIQSFSRKIIEVTKIPSQSTRTTQSSVLFTGTDITSQDIKMAKEQKNSMQIVAENGQKQADELKKQAKRMQRQAEKQQKQRQIQIKKQQNYLNNFKQSLFGGHNKQRK